MTLCGSKGQPITWGGINDEAATAEKQKQRFIVLSSQWLSIVVSDQRESVRQQRKVVISPQVIVYQKDKVILRMEIQSTPSIMTASITTLPLYWETRIEVSQSKKAV